MHRHGATASSAKRLVDVIGAFGALVVLSPVLAVITVTVRVSLGRPILFVQQRPGLGGRPFPLYKFRTMREQVDARGTPLPDAERLTGVGRFLRSTSLDELPELWNVIRGDMSLVGPRPLLIEYLPLYTARQSRRHDVRPGVTGWAQVNGRNQAGWAERLAMDIWYVDNWSLRLDLRILARTVLHVLRRQGVNEEGHATKPVFTGAPDLDP